MEHKLPQYRPIELSAWPRREHYEYYRTKLKCSYSLTRKMDVTALVRCAQERELGKYACFIYVIARTVNGMDEMKMMCTPDGTPGIWERVHPNVTVFHEDDKTFTDLWTEYEGDFSAFYSQFRNTMETWGDCHGVKGRPGQPVNFFCVSCIPWMDYTGYATQSAGEPPLFPIVTFGKYVWEGARCVMPVTLTISHAASDGYHSCMFFQGLQENLDQFEQLISE